MKGLILDHAERLEQQLIYESIKGDIECLSDGSYLEEELAIAA